MKNLVVYVAQGYMIVTEDRKYYPLTAMIEMINTDSPHKEQFRYHTNDKWNGHKTYDFYKSEYIFNLITGYKPDEAKIQYVIV